MLAPSAITVRRPSGEVDLILSKAEERTGIHGSHEFFVPPLRNCKSENTSPVGSSAPSPAGSTTTLSQSTCGTTKPTVHESPSNQKKSWFKKVVKLKEDLDKISKAIKMKKAGGSTEHICWILSPDADLYDSKRTVRVEKVSDRRKSLTSCKLHCKSLSIEQDDHNFSGSLIMTSLGDGYFNAELSTSNLPKGDIIIRLRDYKLEILLMDSLTFFAKQKHEGSKFEPRAKYCGSISMPIYVMPETLEVILDCDRDLLLFRAMTKGFQFQRNSHSATDLRHLDQSLTSPTSPSRSPPSVEYENGNHYQPTLAEQDFSSLYVVDGMRERANTS